MTEPVTMTHLIKFETSPQSVDHQDHARRVCDRLRKIAPLLIREAELESEIEKVRQQIQELSQ